MTRCSFLLGVSITCSLVLASLMPRQSLAFITPVSAIATSSQGGEIDVANLINGSGLTDLDGTDTVIDDLHDNDAAAATMWHAGCEPGLLLEDGPACRTDDATAPLVTDQLISFNLGATYRVAGAHIWQMNQALFAEARSIDQMRVWVGPAVDNIQTYALADTIQLESADGSGLLAAQYVTFANVFAGDSVVFEILSAHSGEASEFVGLSEVRFEGEPVPEPAALYPLLVYFVLFFGSQRQRRRRRQLGFRTASLQ